MRTSCSRWASQLSLDRPIARYYTAPFFFRKVTSNLQECATPRYYFYITARDHNYLLEINPRTPSVLSECNNYETTELPAGPLVVNEHTYWPGHPQP
ncbi:lysyl-tRNA synthetase [Histoplasma ohiense]|nr:lysyl-tRNA synthetase [Histoplasma ohiense (nom. inval.)]